MGQCEKGLFQSVTKSEHFFGVGVHVPLPLLFMCVPVLHKSEAGEMFEDSLATKVYSTRVVLFDNYFVFVICCFIQWYKLLVVSCLLD